MEEPGIGTLFNSRYLLEAELGRGGMGVVYRAHDNLLERKVAVKLLSSKQIGTEGRARMLREAQAAARLNHPNIVSIFDAGETDGISFIIMELLEGEALYDLKPLPLEKALEIIRQVCKALEHAHAHGIVHRDLKPENVIVSPAGIAKLTDFGLARSAASRLTAEGAFIGTIHYMSPEQALGEDVDGRTDLYALGAMLYELAAGRLPFTGDDPLAIISQHLHAPVIPPRNYNPDLPPALDRLIVKLLSKPREERPASAALVRQALDPEALQASAPGPAEPLSSLDILVRGRLVGREQELAEAKLLWRQAMAGTSPQPILLISGEPGIGKTPLVREVKALAEVSGGTVLVDECYAEGSAPYAPLSQVIQQALQKDALNLPDVILADLVELSPGLRARYTQLTPNQPLDSTSGQHRLFESVVALFSTLAERSPILLILEDVHWADASTLNLLNYLARRARATQMRLMIVLTYRESELENAHSLRTALPEFNRERLAARIKLGRYDRQQTSRLLSVMFQEPVDPAFAEAIFKETDGNLFFIEEICRALIEQGKLTHQHGGWQWSDLKDLELPQSVRLATQSRLGSLPANTQDVLRLAAIIGREFNFDILHAACDLPEDDLVQALETAERAQLITEIRTKQNNGSSSSEHFAFVHGLIVTTLRSSVSGLRRHRLHRRVAAAISSASPEDYPALAYHYQQAQDLPTARGYYIKAGERALSIYANQEAVQYFRAALELIEDDAERTLLLANLGEALFRQSLYEEAIEAWVEAIHLHSRHAEYDAMARLYSRAARSAWYAGEARRGLELCLQGMHDTASAPESPGKAALLHETARAYFFNGQREETGPLCHQALEMAERLGLVEVQADTLATFGLLPDLPYDTKRQRLTRAVELAESAGLLVIAARAHLNLGGRLQEDGELPQARAHFLRAYELAQKMGMDTWAYDFLSSAAYVSLDMGDFPAVEAALAELKAMGASPITSSQVGALANILEVRLYAYQGRWEQAEGMLSMIEEQVRTMNDISTLAQILSMHGWMLLEQGKLTEAHRYLDEAIGLSRDASAPTFEPFFFSFMLAVDEKDVQSARLYHAAMAEFLAVAKQDQRAAEMAKWADALLAGLEDHWDQALGAFETLNASPSYAGQRWTRARTLLNWGEVLIGRNQPGDLALAREKILAAQVIFAELKAEGYLEKIHQLLARLEAAQPTARGASKAP